MTNAGHVTSVSRDSGLARKAPSEKGTVVTTQSRSAVSRHLTVAQLCDDLGVARSTFYDWRTKRSAPRCIRLPNGEIRIRRTDLDAWLTAREEDVA